MKMQYLSFMEMIGLMIILTIIFFSSGYSFTMKSKMQENTNFKMQLKQKFLSLFVSFDPKTSEIFMFKEMNWIVMILLVILISVPLWMKPTRVILFQDMLKKEMENQLKISLKTKKDGSSMIFIMMFLFIFLSNMLGLIPNLFTATSHMSVNLILAIPLWMGFLLFGWWKFTNKMLAHLVPSGTPFLLISFMVLIEMMSNIIRPLTLSIRLMANMVSGHLLMTLMGNSMSKCNMIFVFIIVLAQTTLLSLEMGVAMIQAYVFCMLMTLYSDESDKM